MAERNESDGLEIPIPGMSSGESDPLAALKELQEYFSEKSPGGLVVDFEEDVEEDGFKYKAYVCNGANIQGDSAGIRGDGKLFEAEYLVDELKAAEREILNSKQIMWAVKQN